MSCNNVSVTDCRVTLLQIYLPNLMTISHEIKKLQIFGHYLVNVGTVRRALSKQD